MSLKLRNFPQRLLERRQSALKRVVKNVTFYRNEIKRCFPDHRRYWEIKLSRAMEHIANLQRKVELGTQSIS